CDRQRRKCLMNPVPAPCASQHASRLTKVLYHSIGSKAIRRINAERLLLRSDTHAFAFELLARRLIDLLGIRPAAVADARTPGFGFGRFHAQQTPGCRARFPTSRGGSGPAAPSRAALVRRLRPSRTCSARA